MKTIKLTILLGLHKSGREKTFGEILDEARVRYTESEELEAAHTLEQFGLIQDVTYKLPLEIRAELTSYGREAIDSLQQQERDQSTRP